MGAYDKRGNLVASKVVNNINKNISDASAEATSSSFPVKVTYGNGHKYGVTEEGDIIENLIGQGETAPNDSNAVYISGNYTAVIPAGFTVSDVKVVNETTGVVEKDETTIENGLVVTDASGNQWVWIPVSSSDLALMYEENTTGWTMLGTAEPNDVVTKYRTLGTTLGSRTLDRTTPGTTADPYYREPDVISLYDTDQTYRTQAAFGDLADMSTKLKDDYKEMIDSVRENGGFYVGKYELGKDSSNNPQVKPGTVMNKTDWYNLYKACKSFSNENVESRMVWGCQWDQICRFIKGSGANLF